MEKKIQSYPAIAPEAFEQRRSANYRPNIWKYDFLESLCSKFDEEEYQRRIEKLTGDVKAMLVEEVHELAKLELIDSVTKLGLSELFEEGIQKALKRVAVSAQNRQDGLNDDLYSVALRFRLLRQYGYQVSQDMFSDFLDENGTFAKSDWVDVKGLLELFEASCLSLEGEDILDEAKDFSKEILKNVSSTLEGDLAKQVAQSLELSSQRRVQWFDVKWNINTYERAKNINPSLLELAKIHFNTVQATLQKDLRETSRWWSNLGLMKDLSFARDRLAECFLCAVGVAYEPQYSNFREWLTKAITLILIIDDVYDIYGSLEELEHFTNAVDRWDPREIQQLPECMKICFQALYNVTNESACEIQEDKGLEQVVLLLKKVWADFCKAMFVEAKWYREGHTPCLQEYLDNGWISSAGTVLCVYSYCSLMHDVPDQEMTTFLEKNQDHMKNVSMIIRLCNDLATSVVEKERGDAPSSILCYMREMNVSEDEARENIKGIINKTWKKLNGQCFTQFPFLQPFGRITTNIARMVHILYQYEDGFGVQDRQTRKQILSLLVEPFET
ncbi:hypothetical protein SLE2022_014500 [Rubroshorea leprosula]